MIGDKFGKLTIIRKSASGAHDLFYECLCDCGKTCTVKKKHLVSKEPIRSCGCLKLSLCQNATIICRECNTEKTIDNFYKKSKDVKTRHNICIDCHKQLLNTQNKQRKRKQRRIVIEHYGGASPVCWCCDEAHYEFLTIDHIDGGGNTHRKTMPHGSGSICRWLIKNNFPPGFRILCYNCNITRGLHGYCPHKR